MKKVNCVKRKFLRAASALLSTALLLGVVSTQAFAETAPDGNTYVLSNKGVYIDKINPQQDNNIAPDVLVSYNQLYNNTDHSPISYGLYLFDQLPQLELNDIEKVELRVEKLSGDDNMPLRAHAVLSSWGSMPVSWVLKPEINPNSGPDALPQSSYYNIDVTDIVMGWCNGSISNYGIALSTPLYNGYGSVSLKKSSELVVTHKQGSTSTVYRSDSNYSEDATVSETYPDTNFGQNPLLMCEGNYENPITGEITYSRSMVKFKGLPTKSKDVEKLVSAKVVFTSRVASPYQLELHNIPTTNNGKLNTFSESTVTWNNRPYTNSIPCGVESGVNKTYTFDITDLIYRWIKADNPDNFAFTMNCYDPGGAIALNSMQCTDPALRPYLELVYAE